MNLTVKCPSCGGVVVLNPKTRQLQCTQCDSVISRGIGEENSAMVRNEDGELVDKRSYKAIQKIARIKRYITDATDTIYILWCKTYGEIHGNFQFLCVLWAADDIG